MGSQDTTGSSGGGDSSPANIVLTLTPMQAKALATLISRSTRHGSGLDAIRIVLMREASEVGSREPSSAAAVLAETKAFGCGSSGGTSGGSGNGAVEVAGFVDAVSFSVEVPAPVCLEVAVAAECS